ncbi:cupredoxin domain-containing protein [uncultured Brevundimonas sp.]|uniref:cupredoxin domain-containing protein n=1 Tax=uncultured Brevundimonas sp. TaxID=213418 RepID=UPI0030EF4E5C|tara:strand:+ start:3307 stop:3657 length:351 start_codon:yes stop_codon:yes gene_type:complete
MKRLTVRLLAAALISGLAATGSLAAGEPTVTLTLRDHRFTPATVTVPAGQRVQVVLINHDRATEEFDSHDLRIEKMVTPGATVRFFIGPLRPGTYDFVGEFHPRTAQGRIVAVAAQ